jgi:hypothetical protein
LECRTSKEKRGFVAVAVETLWLLLSVAQMYHIEELIALALGMGMSFWMSNGWEEPGPEEPPP